MHATRVRFGTGSLGFCCRVASSAVAVAHGPFVVMEVEKWLGEEFSTGGCSDHVYHALALQMAFASGAISAEDVPGDVDLDDVQLVYVTALLQSVVDDVVGQGNTNGEKKRTKTGNFRHVAESYGASRSYWTLLTTSKPVPAGGPHTDHTRHQDGDGRLRRQRCRRI